MEIRYYRAPNGRSPFMAWLEKLPDRTVRAKIKVKIDRLMRGLFGDTRAVGGGVEELRLHFGPGYRIYYGRIRETIVLLHGGEKRGQRRDIAKAKAYWSAFLEVRDDKTQSER